MQNLLLPLAVLLARPMTEQMWHDVLFGQRKSYTHRRQTLAALV